MEHKFTIKAGDFTKAGEVSSIMKKMLKQLGINADKIRKASIASYEAELNLIIHSLGGNMSYSVTPEKITIITEDIGPGIDDIELAMSEGYSTASDKVRELGFGAGMGLPNIKRCADEIEIYSKDGEGTSLIIKINI